MNWRTQTCPCCDNSLLRHIRHGKIYWFCSRCRQEVPLLTLEQIPIETNINAAIAVSEKLGA